MRLAIAPTVLIYLDCLLQFFFFCLNVQEKCVLIILKKEIVQSQLKVARHCTQQAPKVSTTRAAWSARQSPHLIIKETAAGIVSC
jgi:hypothetical protein